MSNILVIGSGLAGLSAALRCAENGRKSVIISEQPSWSSQSVLAAGGINAALDNCGENDTQLQHENDTWESGCHLADREAVHNLSEHAPLVIKYLEDCGVIFSRNKDGSIAQRNFGGQKKKRTCYSNANIGRQLVSGLEQKVRYYESKGMIEILDHHIFLDIIKEEEMVCGIIVADRYSGRLMAIEGQVIVASGGMSGLFGNTTGSVHSDGSVTAALYMAGVKLSNLEMIQYHPTTARTVSKNMLISEAARGEGGRLFAYRGGKKWYFCEEWFGENGNLMPRDVVSRAIYKVLNGSEADKSDVVWLDLTHIDKAVIENKLSEVNELCLKYLGINPANEPIPVVPAIHYFMGGIWVDVNHRTSIKGLYAAGECCSQYHGANRLGGNSTLGAIYGGQCAAEACIKDNSAARNVTKDSLDGLLKNMSAQLNQYTTQRDRAQNNRNKLQLIMRESMGIIRDNAGLTAGKDKLEQLNLTGNKSGNKRDMSENSLEKQQTNISIANLLDIYSYNTFNMSRLGNAMLDSALERKESRGAHYRSDYPDTDKSYDYITETTKRS